jgi:hypothetical protein
MPDESISVNFVANVGLAFGHPQFFLAIDKPDVLAH